MLRHTYKVEIDSAPTAVWKAMSDFGGSSWIPKVVETRPASRSPEGVGAEQVIEHLILKQFRKRVISWEDGQRVEFEYLDIPAQITSMSENWWLAETRDGTVVTVDQQLGLDVGDLTQQVGMFVSQTMKEDLVDALAGLKCHVETGEVVTSDFIQLAATEQRERYTSVVKPG